MFVKDDPPASDMSTPAARSEASLRVLLELDTGETTPGKAPRPAGARERILDAAIRVFAARGFGSTTMRDLAAEVGIKAPGLYAHFASKEDILAGAMLRALHGFIRSMVAPAAPGSPAAMLEMTVRRHVRYQLAHLATTRANDLLLASDALGDFLSESDLRRVRAFQRGYCQLVRCRIQAALPPQSDVNAAVAAFAVINLCDMVTSWYQQGGHLSVEDVENQYWALVRNMLDITL
jgi:AcrR family transcriptional regulator